MTPGEYEYHEPPDALIARIEAIHAGDKTAEQKQAQWGCGCVLAGLAAFAMIFLADDWASEVGVGYWAFFAVLIVTGIFALTRLLKHSARNLDDRKIATLQRLMKVLRADLPPDRPVRLRVDFRPYTEGGKKISTEKLPMNVTSDVYAHEWLRVRGALADGTVADLALSEDVKRKEKPKRKRNKVKERMTAETTVLLRLARQYGDAAVVAERLKTLPPPPGMTVSAVKGTGRRLQASLRSGTFMNVTSRRVNRQEGKQADGDTLLLSLRWVYRGMAPGA